MTLKSEVLPRQLMSFMGYSVYWKEKTNLHDVLEFITA